MSNLSANEGIFKQHAPFYNNARKLNKFDKSIYYIPNTELKMKMVNTTSNNSIDLGKLGPLNILSINKSQFKGFNLRKHKHYNNCNKYNYKVSIPENLNISSNSKPRTHEVV